MTELVPLDITPQGKCLSTFTALEWLGVGIVMTASGGQHIPYYGAMNDNDLLLELLPFVERLRTIVTLNNLTPFGTGT